MPTRSMTRRDLVLPGTVKATISSSPRGPKPSATTAAASLASPLPRCATAKHLPISTHGVKWASNLRHREAHEADEVGRARQLHRPERPATGAGEVAVWRSFPSSASWAGPMPQPARVASRRCLPAPASYQRSDRLTMATTESITGTSISTPTTVASAAPEPKPKRLIAVATASSKKFEAPIRAEGPATQCGEPTARLRR